MKINPHIFRENDVRGLVDIDLSPQFAQLLGRAFGALIRDKGKNRIAIGFDCRHTSKSYAQAFMRGLSMEGINSVLTGMGPTPQLYYAVFSQGFTGGVQVTGSHNPPDTNGFKFSVGKHTLSGEEIQELRRRVEQMVDTTPTVKKSGLMGDVLIRDSYLAFLVKNSLPCMGTRKLKVVVDAGNGTGGLVAPEALRKLGVEVIELYCEPNGDFPNHYPDPTVLENIVDLQKSVIAHKADFGVGFDGDADRIGVVDENGQVIFADLLMLIYAREILERVPHPTIIADVKCSSRLFEDLKARGATTLMWKTGHSFLKNKLFELNAELAGELSGHICFNDRYFGYDDAIYSAVRLVEIMSKTEAPLSSLLSNVPKMFSTPEIRVPCHEEIKFKIAEQAREIFSKYELSLIDGVRIQFEHGWGLLRASNTEPALVMRFEAENEGELAHYQKIVEQAIAQVTENLRELARSNP